MIENWQLGTFLNVLWSLFLSSCRTRKKHTYQGSWICREFPDLNNHLQVSWYWCVFFRLPFSHYYFLFTFKWQECVSHITLSVSISCLLFKAMTFYLVSRRISFFFHWEVQSFSLLKYQKLTSAAFFCFQ